MKVIMSSKKGVPVAVDSHKVALFKKAVHPHLCALHEVMYDKKSSKATLFCPFAPNGSLKDRIEGTNLKPMNEANARKYFR
mmetsp:Transcript_13466/g.21038  ORF Transcript_13466/g.21038 Transcript_13466/m.21038 type:complete len:81 (-) Transcript_13466:603-845(-)